MSTKDYLAQLRAPVWLMMCGIFLAHESSADDTLKVAVTRVEQRELIEEVPLTGTVSSPKISVLSSEVAGLVSSVHVDAGDQVSAGDLLLELDSELSAIDRDSARAAARGARAAWEETKKRLEDAQALVAQKNIAASEVRALEAQVEIDNASWQAADAEARRQAAEFQRHHLNAPFSGVVSRKLVEVGEWLAPGAEVVELVATNNLRIDFQVPQRFYPRINNDTAIQLGFDAYPEQTFQGRVHRKVPLSDNSARTFLLRVLVDETERPALIPGMSVRATLNLLVDGEGIVAPRDALLRYPDGRVSVWIVEDVNPSDKTAKVREQQVTLGLAFNNLIEIRSGLEVGQQVVVRGNESLQANQTVTLDNLTDE